MAVNLSMLAGAGAQFFDNNGNPLTGGKIYTYAAGTTTPVATYTTNAGNVAHPNPIILDAAGRVPSGGEIWLTNGISYKFVVKTSTEVIIGTYDNILNSAGNIYSELSASDGSSLVGFIQSGTGAVATTVQSKLQEMVSVFDFMTAAQVADVKAGTASIDVSTPIQAALNTGKNVVLPDGIFSVGTTLVVNSDQKISGHGYIKSSIVGNNVFNVLGKQNVVFSGISIETAAFPAFVSGALSNAIYADSCSNIEINGVRFVHKTKNRALYLKLSSNCRVSNNYATCSDLSPSTLGSYTPESFIVGDGCEKVTIIGNTVYNSGIGIYLENLTSNVIKDITISGNTVSEVSGYGICTYAGGVTYDGNIVNVSIVGNAISKSYGSFYNTAVPAAPYTHGAGIYVLNGRQITISANTIRKTNILTNSETLTPGAIGVVDSKNCVISDNVIVDAAYYGVIYDGVHGVVSNNVILNSVKAAIYSRKSENCIFLGNSIRFDENATTHPQGILLSATSGGVHRYDSVSNNTVYDANIGVYLQNASLSVISGNTIQNVNWSQLYSFLSGSDCSNISISDNVLLCKAGTGLSCSSPKSHVKGNQIYGAGSGTAVAAIGAGSIIGFNRIDAWSSDNKTALIQLPAATFLNTGYYAESGITIQLTSTGSIQGCVIDDTARQVDIYIYAGAGSTLVHLGASTGGIKFRNKSGANITTDSNTVYHYRSYGDGTLWQI